MSSQFSVTKLGESNDKKWKADIMNILSPEILICSPEVRQRRQPQHCPRKGKRLRAMEGGVWVRYADESTSVIWRSCGRNQAGLQRGGGGVGRVSSRSILRAAPREQRTAELGQISDDPLICGTTVDLGERWFYSMRGSRRRADIHTNNWKGSE